MYSSYCRCSLSIFIFLAIGRSNVAKEGIRVASIVIVVSLVLVALVLLRSLLVVLAVIQESKDTVLLAS